VFFGKYQSIIEAQYSGQKNRILKNTTVFIARIRQNEKALSQTFFIK
jgi:hypothetical protein